uniref:protein-tyrosine-phosphatase n=1 Tax=Knipowitschia caucasica TaxID=637954 RepID=A0AAV2KVM7_KNICA
MLWENNSTIVVMLTKLREMEREKCHQYWPSSSTARSQYLMLEPMAEYNMPQYILREFKITDARIHVTAKLSLLRICVCVKKESARLRRLLIAIGDLP